MRVLDLGDATPLPATFPPLNIIAVANVKQRYFDNSLNGLNIVKTAASAYKFVFLPAEERFPVARFQETNR